MSDDRHKRESMSIEEATVVSVQLSIGCTFCLGIASCGPAVDNRPACEQPSAVVERAREGRCGIVRSPRLWSWPRF